MRHVAALTVLLTGLIAAPSAARAHELFAFRSPSGNIGCQLDASAARCDIRARDWSPPPEPAGCEVDYGQGLTISRTGSRGRFVCAGDTALGAGPTLAYGRTVRRGGISCTSQRSGVTCKNARGHGFRLSRESHRRF